MPPGAQDYIDQWRALALGSGVLALAGALVGAWGIYQAYRTLTVLFDAGDASRTAKLLAWGDLAALGVLTTVGVMQTATSVALVWLAEHYSADLAPVLLALDGAVTRAYLGYALQVALGTLGLATWETFRVLATRAERKRIADERRASQELQPS